MQGDFVHRAFKTVGVVLAGLAASGATAQAAGAPFTCQASAARGTVLGQPLAPITANAGAPACADARAGATTPLPPPLTATAMGAATSSDGEGPTRRVIAAGGMGALTIGLPQLPAPTLSADLLPATTIPVPVTLPVVGTLTLQVDIRDALLAVAPEGRLPSELLSVGALWAIAAGTCSEGTAHLDASRSVTGLRVLGQDVALDSVTERALTLTAGTVDPSNIDLTKVEVVSQLPLGVTLQQVLSLLDAPLRAALDRMPSIDIPAAFAVRVTPGTVVRTPTRVVATGARVEVGLAGTSVADLIVGEATVGSAGVDCSARSPVGPASVAEAALECTSRRVVLTDVRPFGDLVRLEGVADSAYIGRRVDVRYDATGERVARTIVGPDGTFEAVAPMPSRRLRSTNRARYRANIGSRRSLNLKLARRMIVTSMRSRRGKVTIAGRVVRPLGRPVRTVTLQRRVSCRRMEVVKRFKPRKDGRFKVTVDAPAGRGTAVYRLSTRVRKTSRNPKLFATYTLPQAVELK